MFRVKRKKHPQNGGWLKQYIGVGMDDPVAEIEGLRISVTKWHEEAKRLAEQNFKLRDDKARLIDYLKLVKQALNKGNVHREGIEQLLTEIGKK